MMIYNPAHELNKNTYQRACEGYYDVKIAYPKFPTKPALLSARGSSLSIEELEKLPELKRNYEQEKQNYSQKVEEIEKLKSAYVNKLKSDLELEHGIGPDNCKANLLFDIAWRMGHSSGITEVIVLYDELVELIK